MHGGLLFALIWCFWAKQKINRLYNRQTKRGDASYQRLAKVQPLLDLFRTQCLQLNSDQVHNIDEQIIPFKDVFLGKAEYK